MNQLSISCTVSVSAEVIPTTIGHNSHGVNKIISRLSDVCPLALSFPPSELKEEDQCATRGCTWS